MNTKQREGEREREFCSPALRSPFTAPVIHFEISSSVACTDWIYNDTKGAPAHLDTILIKQWYCSGIALCKADMAKPRNSTQETLNDMMKRFWLFNISLYRVPS